MCVCVCVCVCVHACVCVCVSRTPNTGLRHPSLRPESDARSV